MNCSDHITKYVTAHLFVEKRTLEKCKEFLGQMKITGYDQILEVYKKEKHEKVKKRNLIRFVCDGFENYKTAWSALFRIVTKLTFGIPIKAKVAGLKYNNNHIERYNGKIKDRIKVMRGGFTTANGAEAFLNLRHIIHNFVNPHQGLKGKTPAEAAEIFLKLGRDKLRCLIKIRAKKIHHSKR